MRRASDEEIIEEAARLICDEGIADYGLARSRAAQELGAIRRTAAIDKRRIEARVIERQQLYGGNAYRQHLADMRQLGLRLLQLLGEYSPRLAGSAVTGAIGVDHRVQIHVLAEPAESVELLLLDRHIPFQQGERNYRLAGGQEELIPLLHLDLDGIGADIAVFPEHCRRAPPLSQIDGKPAVRLALEQVRVLLEHP